jgi:hypothetical protein
VWQIIGTETAILTCSGCDSRNSAFLASSWYAFSLGQSYQSADLELCEVWRVLRGRGRGPLAFPLLTELVNRSMKLRIYLRLAVNHIKVFVNAYLEVEVALRICNSTFKRVFLVMSYTGLLWCS